MIVKFVQEMEVVLHEYDQCGYKATQLCCLKNIHNQMC